MRHKHVEGSFQRTAAKRAYFCLPTDWLSIEEWIDNIQRD